MVRVRRTASASIHATISTSCVSYCWATAQISPESLKCNDSSQRSIGRASRSPVDPHPHRDTGIGRARLSPRRSGTSEVEDRRGQHRVGAGLDRLREVLERARAAGGDERDRHARADACSIARSNPALVPSRSIDVNRISPAAGILRSARPVDGVDARSHGGRRGW